MVPNSDKLMEDLLKGIEGLTTAEDKSLSYSRIPFGVPNLDKMLGGGIPRKRISIFTGPTNSGKSYLASLLVRNVQKNKGVAVWIDTEMSIDRTWLKQCGVDPSKLLVFQSSNGEKCLGTVRNAMQQGVDLVVVDSVAGLVPSNVLKEDFDYNPIAWQARFINSAIPKLIDDLHHGSALVLINQVRSSMGPVYLDNMPGGMGQTFFSHFILQVRRDGWIEEDKKRVGFDMKIVIKKTKVGSDHWDEVVIPFRIEGGIDVLEILLREAIELKIIKKSGAWFKVYDQTFQGMNGIKEAFIKDEKLVVKLTHDMETARSNETGKSSGGDSD